MGIKRAYCALLMVYICRDERNGLEETTTSEAAQCTQFTVCMCVCVCVCVCTREEGEREGKETFSHLFGSVWV